MSIPHMSNLPWIQIYAMVLMMILMMYANSMSKYSITKSLTPKQKNMKKKWTW